jgi:hypothetical protein
VSPMQTACLKALAMDSRPDGEMRLPFRTIEARTGFTRTMVKRAVRSLARQGYAEFHKGLCNYDGEFAGAGYCITALGLMVLPPVAETEVLA